MPARGVGEGEWIISYTVEDSETGQVLIEADFEGEEDKYIEYAPILGGANLTVTFTIDVIAGGSGNLRLITGMQHSTIESDRFWELVTKDYDLGEDFNPNSASTEFTWTMGNFTMRCYGKTPLISKPTALILVQLSSTTGDILDNIKPTIVTAVVDEFQNLYDQKEDKLRSLISSGVASGYTQLFENVLTQSNNLASLGYVDEAIALLNSLPGSGEPMGSALEMVLIPAIGIGAVAAVVFAFMFLRARGKNSYTQMVIEDQIKDLEGLTLRAARIDRRLSSSLESVKDRLKSLVGM
jgi:hypothetical protein